MSLSAELCLATAWWITWTQLPVPDPNCTARCVMEQPPGRREVFARALAAQTPRLARAASILPRKQTRGVDENASPAGEFHRLPQRSCRTQRGKTPVPQESCVFPRAEPHSAQHLELPETRDPKENLVIQLTEYGEWEMKASQMRLSAWNCYYCGNISKNIASLRMPLSEGGDGTYG